jgi:carbonic anhydrase
MNDWLKSLRDLYDKNRGILDKLEGRSKEKKLSELNIERQIRNLSKIPCIQKAWETRDFPKLHGWYFDLMSGSLKEVFSMEENHKLKKVGSLA